MSTSAKRLLISGVALAAIGFGLFAMQSRQQKQDSPPTVATYELILPSIGPLPETVGVSLERSSEDITKAAFTQTDARIAPDMTIILYDDNNKLVTQFGRVTAFSNGNGQAYLPPTAGTVKHGDIIIHENETASRVPADAIDGDTLWKARLEMDGTYRAIRTTLSGPPVTARGYTMIDGAVQTDEYVIANPDGRLQDGQLVHPVIVGENNPPPMDMKAMALRSAGDEKTNALITHLEAFPPPPAEGESGIAASVCPVDAPP